MERIELSAEKPKPTFRFQMGKTPGKVIFSTSDLVIGYDEPLSKPINRVLEKGQKVVITGANGLGKTTLMKSLMGLDPTGRAVPSSWVSMYRSAILNRKSPSRSAAPASRNCGRPIPPIPNMKSAAR